MTQDYELQYRQRKLQRQPQSFWDVVWDVVRGVVVHVLYMIVDGIARRVKEEIRAAFGYEQQDWRSKYV